MTQTVIIHIPNEDPILGELDELPSSTDILITVHNPRRRDGKDIHYLQNNVMTVIWPVSQIVFIEVLPSEAGEQVLTHVRE